MEIIKNVDTDKVTLALKGRLDTTTAPSLESVVGESTEAAKELIIDCKELEYISSAGLRVLLSAHKAMTSHGKLVIKNVCDDIMEVFEITGFSDILCIE